MKAIPEDRCKEIGRVMVDKSLTIRQVAKEFGISKSTVHKDITERLALVDPMLYAEVKSLIEKNKRERAMRGGMQTKAKFEALKRK